MTGPVIFALGLAAGFVAAIGATLAFTAWAERGHSPPEHGRVIDVE